jgi:uncharacterized protein YjbI with pentapeptide repeats
MSCNAGYDWCKEHPVVHKDSGKEYCVFHAPKDKKGISTEEFNILVFAEINRCVAAETKCDFSGTVFPGDIDFQKINEKKLLPAIDFFRAQFSGKAAFFEAQFSGESTFYRAQFSGEATFFEAQFSGEATFFGAQFSGEAHFMGAQFSGKADFFEAQFSGVASFNGAQFSDEANFFGAQFSGKAYFFGAQFSGKAYFSYAKFSKEAQFKGKTFNKQTTYINLNIDNRILFENVVLKKLSFIDTDLRKVDFLNCDWPELKDGRRILYDEAVLTKESSKDDIKKVEILYRQLKQKYKEEHDEPEVSNWHRCEKEMERKGTDWRHFQYYVLNLYRFSSGYGEAPVRAGLFLVMLICLTALLLNITGLIPDKTSERLVQLSSEPGSLVFEMSSNPARKEEMISSGELFATTLEYLTFQKNTAYKPANWLGRIVVSVFKIFVYVQATLFAFALRNRFRR